MPDGKTNRAPVVSVGLPVFNGEAYLAHAIDSILSQDFGDLELIISDNSSTDGTGDLCRSYVSRDPRVRYFRNERNMGPVWNYNRVFELSSGKYYMWAAHDDYWEPEYLRVCVEALEKDAKVVLAGTLCRCIDPLTDVVIVVDTGLSTAGLSPRERFRQYKSIIHAGKYVGGLFYGLYRRNVLERSMPLQNKITIDHILLSRMCLYGDFVTIARPLMTKRWGGASTSIKNIARTLGIENKFEILFPYVDRELMLQRTIYSTDVFSGCERAGASLESFAEFVRAEGVMLLGRVWRSLPRWIRRPVKRIISRRSASEKT